jgi:hypothetical protein
MCACGAMSPSLQHSLALAADQMLQSGAVQPRRPGRTSPGTT